MEIYEIRPTGEGKRCVLSGPLGIVDSIEIDTIREAALHAQFCAGTAEAILRTFNEDGTSRRTGDPAADRRLYSWGTDHADDLLLTH